ncbi:hypothetical protein MMC31_006014 [Peltigera leucophlebia]|nr:hypothetical protein [Peltigera leucophlebia]
MGVVATILTPVILASAVVSLRVYSKIKLKSLDLSDCCLGAGWVFLVAATVLATLTPDLNGGSPPTDYLCLILSQQMSVMADAFVKAFIILTVLKPLGSHGIFRRRFLYFSLAVVLLLSIATFIVNFVQCNPPSELWRQVWRQGRALCWNPLIYEDLTTVRNSLSVTIGFFIALISLTVIRDLHHEWKFKVGLWILVFLGVVACVCGSIKTSDMNELSGVRPARFPNIYGRNIYSPNALGFWDTSLLIICGSCPQLKPLYDRIRVRRIYDLIVTGRPLATFDTESQNTGTALTSQNLPHPKLELDGDDQRHEIEAEERRIELQSNEMYELPVVERATELRVEGGFELPSYRRRST